jgi:hypothetical protein
MSRDVQERPLDANGHAVRNLGAPTAAKDATFTDNETVPSAIGRTASAGTSLLAAPADHAHDHPAPTRVAAAGKTVLAPGARVTLATIKREPQELFPPGGYVFVRDDVNGVTWENEVNGADHIATYHERTGTPNELRFRALNASDKARTVEWATVALATSI